MQAGMWGARTPAASLPLMMRFFLLYSFALYLILAAMSDKTPDDVIINMGGKQVPLSKINKPHNVVIGGTKKAVPNVEQFPAVEPEAKAREESLKKEREQRLG